MAGLVSGDGFLCQFRSLLLFCGSAGRGQEFRVGSQAQVNQCHQVNLVGGTT